MSNNREKMIEIINLKKYFPMKKKQVLKAVDNVTMDIYKGEVLSLVGESGSGKTTLGRTLSILYPKTAGKIILDGKSTDDYKTKEFTKKVQMIFQDPQASLNPRMTVGDIIAEGIDIHKLASSKKERNLTLLFIAHDLSMVKYISNRVAVMYRGKVVELGEPDAVYNDPIHSYTKSLLSAVPVADPTYNKREKVVMEEDYLRDPVGDILDINKIPEKPELTEYKPGHFVETSFLEEHKLI